MAHILIVDDEPKMRHLLSIMLKRKGHTTDEASDGVEALEKIKQYTNDDLKQNRSSYDMVISDIKMPKMDGLELLKALQNFQIQCPVIFITAFASVDSAVTAMRQGAIDYITKPFEEDRILLTVERALNVSRILDENIALKHELQQADQSGEIIYASQQMADLLTLASRVAETDSAVLIMGESGTGKELLAKYIHSTSRRKGKRFVPINCAAISQHLVESELFGHEKGAFTGADRRAIGKFEYASGGTIFLDEIGDLPLEAQAKLLRALQEKKINRVGGNEEIAVDVRVLCATNKNLEEMVEKKEFRQDLYFRINVFPLKIAPLRERMSDVVPLANHFLKKLSGSKKKLTKEAISVLMNYSWQGNVRELANAMERAVILSGDSNLISEAELSFLKHSPVVLAQKNNGFKLPPTGIKLEEVEKDFVKQALEFTGYNQTAAANLLGLTRAKFRVLLKQVKMSNSNHDRE